MIAIERLLADDTAGDPMTGLRWARRTTAKIADLLATQGFEISPNTVARLLHEMDYSLRVNRKAIATTHSPDRNDQFEYIADVRRRFQRQRWKTELHAHVATTFDLHVTVAHYPTGASKWNPIEHRLFSEISKNWAGEPLDSYQKILNFIRTTRTRGALLADQPQVEDDARGCG